MDRGPWTPRAERGVTLLELVVVIVIMAMLLGLSVVLFRNANRDLGVRASANHCVALVRSVGDHARATRSPGWIVLDVAEGSIHTLVEETVRAWNFEDTAGSGAFGERALPKGQNPPVIVPGRDGHAVQLAGQTSLQCGELPVYAPDQGIGIEFWVYRFPARGKRIICTIGQQVEIAHDPAGRIIAKIGALALTTKDVVVPLERWVHVKLVYSGSEARLYVNGLDAGDRAGGADWTRNSPLVLGADQQGLSGNLDSFRVTLVIPRDKYYLPRDVQFVLPDGTTATRGQFTIAFTPDGRLDPARHPNGVTFTVRSPTDQKTITISPLGHIVR